MRMLRAIVVLIIYREENIILSYLRTKQRIETAKAKYSSTTNQFELLTSLVNYEDVDGNCSGDYLSRRYKNIILFKYYKNLKLQNVLQKRNPFKLLAIFHHYRN